MCFPIGMKMQSETDSVKYSIDEVDLINNAIKNSRLTLHQMDNYEDLA